MQDISKVMLYIRGKTKSLSVEMLKALDNKDPNAVLLNAALTEVKDIEDYLYKVLEERLRREMPVDSPSTTKLPKLHLVKEQCKHSKDPVKEHVKDIKEG